MPERIANDASAIVYRCHGRGLGLRVAFFGGAALMTIALELGGLVFGNVSLNNAAGGLIVAAGLLAGLLIVVRAELRGRPCLILRDDGFTYLGYLNTKEAKWSDVGPFTVHASSTGDDSLNASSEPTRTLRAWIVKGASDRKPRRKPDFEIGDRFDISIDELRLVLNRRIEAARAVRRGAGG
jgi:hypothetical protein